MTLIDMAKLLNPWDRTLINTDYQPTHNLWSNQSHKTRTFRVHTGNINNYVELTQKRFANSAEELGACLNLQFSKLPGDTQIDENGTLLLADKTHREPFYERDDLKITLKLFIKDFRIESVRDAIQSTIDELQIDNIEQLIIAFPHPDPPTAKLSEHNGASAGATNNNTQQNAQLVNGKASSHDIDNVWNLPASLSNNSESSLTGTCATQVNRLSEPLNEKWFAQVLKLWNEIDEQFVKTGKVFSLGVSDFSFDALKALYQEARVKPCVDHFNMESCCVIPSNLQNFAKTHDIQLLTHNDLSPFPLKDVFHSFCDCSKNETRGRGGCTIFEPTWAARYTIWVRRRSLMAAKGYIVQFNSTRGFQQQANVDEKVAKKN